MAWRNHAAWGGVVALLSAAFGWVETTSQQRMDSLDQRLTKVEARGEWFFRNIAGRWYDNPAEFGE